MTIRKITVGFFLIVFLALGAYSQEIDLINRANQAKWTNSASISIPFGADGQANGSVKHTNNARLEDNKTYPRILFTHPNWAQNGMMIGSFENISIPSTGGRIYIAGGFMEGASGTDGVTFSASFIAPNQLDRQQNQLRRRQTRFTKREAMEGVNLAKFTARYDGRIDRVEGDLSSIAGQTGTIILSVNAGNNANSDWAVWTEARLVLGGGTTPTPKPVQPDQPQPAGRTDVRMVGAIKEHSSRIEHSLLSPNGRYLLTIDAGRTAMIWQLPSGKEILTFGAQYSNPPAFSSDSRHVAVGTGNGTVEIWDVSRENRTQTLHGHSGRVHSARFSPNGSYLVTAGADGSARVWDIRSGQEIALIRHSDRRGIAVYSALFMADGRRIITSGEDGVSRIWEVNLR
ncbi:MAG: hypothetical protein JXB26_01530 [Candidatus Aminicenantes bacterium]|nr:hypothetical protein [Candidatus Aminicenantes bacterium]